jgi:hypothetical protein
MNSENIKIEFNESVNTNLAYFLQLIKSSLSLGLKDKYRVLYNLPKLSQKKVDVLIDIFDNDSKKYNEISANYPLDVLILQRKAEREWAILSSKLDLPESPCVH